jgi:heptosyltransferase II
LRAIIIQPGFLGDAVFLGPAVRALQGRWPEGRIAICTTPRGAAAARLLSPNVEVLIYDKRGRDRGVTGLWRAARQLRALRPDMALVPHRSLRSGALAWLSGAPRRIGYSRPFCNERLVLDRTRPFVDRALLLADRAGASSQDRSLWLGAPTELAGYADRILSGAASPVVGIVPGAEWATKRWGAEKFAVLVKGLASRGATVVLLGAPVERGLAAKVIELSGVPVRDTTGNSIDQAIALLARCQLVVGGDTGLVHCARALGRPAVILFGPTDPGRHRFDGREHPIRLRLDCQPCHDHGPERCPLEHHECMKRLPEALVVDKALELLGGRA